MLKQYLNLKLSQKLSPQQIQLMKLIQLPTQAFEERIKQELEENLALPRTIVSQATCVLSHLLSRSIAKKRPIIDTIFDPLGNFFSKSGIVLIAILGRVSLPSVKT